VHSTGDLYNSNDHIQLLNNSNLNANLYGQDQAVFIEFYAHWCGACQNYAKHWKELARETLGWHANVVRVAAIDCGRMENEEICREHSVQYYPTLKIFPPKSQHSKHGIIIQKGSMESILNEVLNFLENVIEKPTNWPILEPFLSKRLDVLFAENRQAKHALLIFEKSDSILGRNIILDFSSYSKDLIIRRTTPETNKALISIMEIDDRRLPLVFIVYNKEQNGKKYERFDSDFVKSQDINNNNGALDRKSLQFLIEAFLKQKNLSQVVNQNQPKHEENSKQFESNKEKFITDLNK
jgi:thiol-disulfide isomerase/thioredoxin